MDGPAALLRWTPVLPTDVLLTLGRAREGRNDPVQRHGPDGSVWRTLRTVDGPATLRVRRVGEQIEAAGWGPGADRAAERAPALLGAADDPAGFTPRHPFLVEAHRRFAGLRIAGTGDVLHGVVGAVLEQRVEGVDAMAAWARLVTALGDPAPGPAPAGMRVFPDGDRWAALPSWRWREAGVDGRRAETIRRAAAVDRGLQRLVGRSREEARHGLASVRGIGVWTAAEVRQRALGDADAVSVGDFHLAGIVGSTLAGRPFTDAELVPFLEPWRPHRYRVARLIHATGIESLPRRAPRAPRG